MGGEQIFPPPGGEVFHLGSGMEGDALEHVDQVGIGIDAVEPASGDQTLDDADLLGAGLSPGK